MQTSPSHTHTHTHTLDLYSLSFCALRSLERIWIEGPTSFTSSSKSKNQLWVQDVAHEKKKKLQEKSEFEILRNRKETGHGNQELCWTSQCTVVKRKMGLCCQRPVNINLSGAHYCKNIEQATGTSIWQCRVTVTSTHNRNLD